jgi:hypothetical protein
VKKVREGLWIIVRESRKNERAVGNARRGEQKSPGGDGGGASVWKSEGLGAYPGVFVDDDEDVAEHADVEGETRMPAECSGKGGNTCERGI